MKAELNNLEKNVNSGLITKIKSSEIKFNYLTIEIEIEKLNKLFYF